MGVTLRSFIRRIHRSIFSLIIVVALAACGSGDGDDGTPTVAITPAAGGMVMPTAAALPTATATEEAVVRLMPGQLLIAIDVVRLYADASRQAIVMNQYGATSAFTVLEPSGEYLAYPVTEEGTDWIRLRADDGLVGWLPANELIPSE